jgi:hypothetical protein
MSQPALVGREHFEIGKLMAVYVSKASTLNTDEALH